MSNLVLSLLLSAAGGMWLYYIFVKKTGYGNNKPAAIGAAASAVGLFIVIYLTLNSIIK